MCLASSPHTFPNRSLDERASFGDDPRLVAHWSADWATFYASYAFQLHALFRLWLGYLIENNKKVSKLISKTQDQNRVIRAWFVLCVNGFYAVLEKLNPRLGEDWLRYFCDWREYCRVKSIQRIQRATHLAIRVWLDANVRLPAWPLDQWSTVIGSEGWWCSSSDASKSHFYLTTGLDTVSWFGWIAQVNNAHRSRISVNVQVLVVFWWWCLGGRYVITG